MIAGAWAVFCQMGAPTLIWISAITQGVVESIKQAKRPVFGDAVSDTQVVVGHIIDAEELRKPRFRRFREYLNKYADKLKLSGHIRRIVQEAP